MATTAAIVAIVAAIAAAAVSAYGAYEAGQTQQKIGKFNAKVAENAAQAKRDAARIEAQNKREQYASILAASRAGVGAAGVMPTEGSPLLVAMDDAANAKLNEARIIYSGEVGARAQESEAIVQRFIGKKAAQQGVIQAGASLLSGVSGAYGSYARYSAGRTTGGSV